jgi:alkylated DNA repair dioxygenase AlkB
VSEIAVGTRLNLGGADLYYLADWLSPARAQQLARVLVDELPWTQHTVRMFGRDILAPRLSAWIGDPGAAYVYSRVLHTPLPWTPSLRELRAQLLATLGADFNSVLANRYRDGRDSMGWHSDDEPELGPQPLIVSVSLGAVRPMRFKSRKTGGERLDLPLASGSLLVMAGMTQHNYLHGIDKSRQEVGERINLTFRQIRPPARV